MHRCRLSQGQTNHRDWGPRSTEELKKTWTQTLRQEHYFSLLKHLRQSEKVYACRCSRKEIRELQQDGSYPGTCRNLNLPFEEQYAWRFALPHNFVCSYQDLMGMENPIKNLPKGDFIVFRKDGVVSYQITSLVDDLESGVNLLVRGMDLLESTGMQMFLAENTGMSQFHDIRFYHRPLLTDEKGRKQPVTEWNFQRKHIDGIVPVDIEID